MMKVHWFIRVSPYFIMGLFMLLLGLLEAFGLLNNDENIYNRIKTSTIFFVLSLVLLFPVIESIKKNIYGKKSWSDIAREAYLLQLISTHNKSEQKLDTIKATFYLSLIIIFIATPILFHTFLNTHPISKYSNTIILIFCLIIYPLTVASVWTTPSKALSKNHKKMLLSVRFFLPALFTLYLIFYVDIVAHYINTNIVEEQVTIYKVNIRHAKKYDPAVCFKRVSIKDDMGIRLSFCLDNIKDNLVNGNVPYIDDGSAVMKTRNSWIGTIVDSITWHQRYTREDRQWSVDEQKYIYLNYD